jgi:hypothetical protein
MLGTGLASLAFYLYSPLSEGSVLLSFLYVAILTFDLIYVVAVIRAKGAGYRCPPDSPYGSVSTPRVPAGRERGDEGHRAGSEDI